MAKKVKQVFIGTRIPINTEKDGVITTTTHILDEDLDVKVIEELNKNEALAGFFEDDSVAVVEKKNEDEA